MPDDKDDKKTPQAPAPTPTPRPPLDPVDKYAESPGYILEGPTFIFERPGHVLERPAQPPLERAPEVPGRGGGGQGGSQNRGGGRK